MINDVNYNNILIPELNAWTNYFNDITIYKIDMLVKRLNILRSHKIIYPQAHEVFRAFATNTPYSTKVIILGQDPYYDGNANGYAFGCKRHISPSLKQIWSSMPSTLEPDDVDMGLEYLARQGVLLLNTVLTVNAREANSHSNIGWKTFTREFLINYSANTKNNVYMLWGNSAKSYTRFIDTTGNLVLTDVHPIHASRNNKDWNCTHFEQANEFFKERNLKTINWK